jgi:molybdate transport system substrate-binding protein
VNLNSRLTKLIIALTLTFISTLSLAEADKKVVIFAAASLTNAIDEIKKMYEKESKIQIQTSYASSSTLAKQIENGAPADIFISADTKWMNYLKEKNALKENTTTNLLNNTLVLIAPKGKAFKVDLSPSFNIDSAFSGKLCTGETESVPVGIYAKQALKSLNWFDKVKSRIVGTQDVRAALVLVERGECDAGIVYETDAKVSDRVEILSSFPDNTHEAIVYPVSITIRAKPEASDFYQYLKSEKAKAVFIKYGFKLIKQ